MDRTESFNDNCGPLGAEVTTALTEQMQIHLY